MNIKMKDKCLALNLVAQFNVGIKKMLVLLKARVNPDDKDIRSEELHT